MAVLFMNEKAASCSGAGVQVFVAAPNGGIDVPGVQLERHIADCVREVPDYED